ncbi:pcd6 interacting protein-related [Anaeramoeba ignava]|uniref:Pcd6 interacting protein-related n=1 Tax=Anaeramoeba ignava TaxID=1746090 RepID=A0A9Q0L6V2_ANAIG|nr:pcd6 interacting protein-related [Anaeramoeba ignava]
MLSFPLKKAERADIFGSLRKFINKNYNKSFADHEKDATTIHQLRQQIKDAVTIDSIENFYQYFAYLLLIEKKFPTKGNDKKALRVNWVWYDAFKNKNCSSYFLELEKASILFNLSAICCSNAADSNLSSADSLRLAVQNFQIAAGALTYIQEQLLPKLPQGMTPDLAPDSIRTLISLNLAQAQECIVEKAINSKMKPITLKKLAIQTAIDYEKTQQLLKSSPISNMVPRNFAPYLEIKKLYFQVLANRYEAQVLEKAQKQGARVSRLTLANSLAKTMSSHLKHCSNLKEKVEGIQKKTKSEFEKAVKENDTIYLQTVPDVSTLTEIPGHSLAAPTPLPDFSKYLEGDLFHGLLPLHSQEGLKRYNELLDNKISTLQEYVSAKNEQIHTTFEELGLPGSILILQLSKGIPEEVRTKLENCKEQGGLNLLTELRDTIKTLREQSQIMLNELVQIIRKEDDEDLQYRLKYGTKWNRPTSGEINAKYMKDISRYTQTFEKASKSDSIIDTKIEKHRSGLEMLLLSEEQIVQKLQVKLIQKVDDQTTEIANELKSYIDKLEAMQSEREKMLNEIHEKKEKDDPMSFLLNIQPHEFLDKAIDTNIQKVYGEFMKVIEDGLQEQDGLLEKVKELNQQFVDSKKDQDDKDDKNNPLQELSSALSAYSGIHSDLEEGFRFYTTFQDSVKTLRNKIEDFVLARDLEKTDLLDSLGQKEDKENKTQNQSENYQIPQQFNQQFNQQNYQQFPQQFNQQFPQQFNQFPQQFNQQPGPQFYYQQPGPQFGYQQPQFMQQFGTAPPMEKKDKKNKKKK